MRAKYIPVFRRRREGKTDYAKRAKALIGRLPLLSVRISNRYVLAQLVKPMLGGDKTLAAVHSKRLLKYGWPFSLKSTPACYLVGYMLGKLALRKGVDRAILYMGVKPFTRGGRVAAVMAGALEAGLQISTSGEVLPRKERLKGEHIAAYARDLRSKDEELYERRFSGLVKAGADPSKYPEYVERILEAIKHE